MLSRAQFALLAQRAQQDPRGLIESAFQITTKNLPGQQPVQLLALNTQQRKIHDTLMRQRAEGRPPRGIVLKARQAGASTLGCGYLTATALTFPYSSSLLISHLEEATVKLFKKCQFMFEGLPAYISPKLVISRREELAVNAIPCVDGEVQLRTSLAVATAGGGEAWRGMTLQTVWLSELAFYQNPEAVLLGVSQAVPHTPQTLLVIESTANGMGNVFHEEWLRAEQGDSDYVPIFIGWWEVDEYRLPVPRDFAPTPEERDLQQALGVSDAQLQWRRYTLYTNCRGSEDLFNQEHPYSPSVAFLMTGRPAFPTRVLQEAHVHARGLSFERGEWSVAENRFVVGTGGSADTGGRLKVYARPVLGHEYMIGADPSSGQPDGDPCCIQVLDRTTETQVAVWTGHLVPTYFAHVMMGLARWYHDAWVAPELNNGHGFAMVEQLKEAQYPRIYVWTRVDKIKHTTTNFYGFETNWKTRPLLIDSLHFALAEHSIGLVDPDTIMELLEFQYFDGRRAEGMKHDDRAMALMIAWRAHLEMPMAGTGRPPRAQDHEPQPPGEIPSYPNAMSAEAWEAVDRDLERMRRQGQQTGFLDDVDLADPGDEVESWGFEPDGLW